jgi:Protein of unknown function (DUF3047)
MRLALLACVLALAAVDPVVIEDWRGSPAGTAGVPKGWRTYGSGGDFKYPPVIVHQDNRFALRLQTERYSIRLAKGATVDLARTPVLEWEWNVTTLPRRGDVRTNVNDQAARILVMFGSRVRPNILGYIWDTNAPAGTEVRSQSGVDRWLIVVRSGQTGLGAWRREARDVVQDYVRLFGEPPPTVRAVAVESHSEDADHQSEAMIGRVVFRPGRSAS